MFLCNISTAIILSHPCVLLQIGLGREEFFRINLSLKQLTEKYPLASTKFWGKIFGTKANYIIAEAEFQEGEGEEEEEEERSEKEQGEGDGDGGTEDMDDDRSDSERDEPPKSQWKPPPTVPKEEPKTGANKMTYFVCNTRECPPSSLAYIRRVLLAVSTPPLTL